MSQLKALVRKRNQLHLNAPQKRRNQGRKRQTFKMMRQLQKWNLHRDFTMVKTSLETKMTQFFENWRIVFQMVTMVNGQDFTIKVIQLLRNIDTCSGMLNTERLCLHIKTIGAILQMNSWWPSTLPDTKINNHHRNSMNSRITLNMVVVIQECILFIKTNQKKPQKKQNEELMTILEIWHRCFEIMLRTTRSCLTVWSCTAWLTGI